MFYVTQFPTGTTIIYPVVVKTVVSKHKDKSVRVNGECKKELILILGSETSLRGQVQTCLVDLGLAINTRPSSRFLQGIA